MMEHSDEPIIFTVAQKLNRQISKQLNFYHGQIWTTQSFSVIPTASGKLEVFAKDSVFNQICLCAPVTFSGFEVVITLAD